MVHHQFYVEIALRSHLKRKHIRGIKSLNKMSEKKINKQHLNIDILLKKEKIADVEAQTFKNERIKSYAKTRVICRQWLSLLGTA
jgi:hypothetical protein